MTAAAPYVRPSAGEAIRRGVYERAGRAGVRAAGRRARNPKVWAPVGAGGMILGWPDGDGGKVSEESPPDATVSNNNIDDDFVEFAEEEVSPYEEYLRGQFAGTGASASGGSGPGKLGPVELLSMAAALNEPNATVLDAFAPLAGLLQARETRTSEDDRLMAQQKMRSALGMEELGVQRAYYENSARNDFIQNYVEMIVGGLITQGMSQEDAAFQKAVSNAYAQAQAEWDKRKVGRRTIRSRADLKPSTAGPDVTAATGGLIRETIEGA